MLIYNKDVKLEKVMGLKERELAAAALVFVMLRTLMKYNILKPLNRSEVANKVYKIFWELIETGFYCTWKAGGDAT